MIGLGTLLNTGVVILGGIVGLLLKNGIQEELQKSLVQACGVATIFIAVSGVLSKMLVFENGAFTTQGTMLLIFSLVIGTVIGEWIQLEARMDALGEKIKKAVKQENDSQFVDGFVSVSLIICVGAMAIVGSIEDGVSGDYSMLAAKAVLDGIIVMVFASTYGIGAVFSAVPVFLYQGAITLVAAFCGSFIENTLIDQLTLVGSALIFCVGVNIIFGKKIKVGNMLPAILIPMLYTAFHFQ